MINPKLPNHEYIIQSASRDVINLAIVENFNGDEINFYPKHYNMDLLKKHISEYVNYDNIMVTNGSGAALDIVLQVFMGSKVLIPVPNYPGFIHSANFYCDVKTVDFDGSDIKILEKHIPDCDIVYVSVPNLPLSYVVDMTELIKKYNKIFIIDEAYYEYTNNFSYISMINKYPNVIVTRTFSKTFALAGARIGYLCANRDLLSRFETINSRKNVLDSSIDYALNAMKNKDIYIKKAKECIELKKEYESKIPINPFSQVYEIISGDTPWLLLRVRNPEAVCQSFLDNKIMIRNKKNDVRDAVRISMCDRKTMNRVLDVLSNYKTIIFDLDGTLRETTTSPLYNEEIIKNIKTPIKILTDNPLPKHIIYKEVSNIVKIEDLICPDLKQKNWYVEDKKLYITRFDASYELFINAKKYDICVIEDNYSENSSEHNKLPNAKMPHLGYLLDFINKPYTIIGKSKKKIEMPRPALMVGDSINDELFAKNNNYIFFKVNSVSKLHELLKTAML